MLRDHVSIKLRGTNHFGDIKVNHKGESNAVCMQNYEIQFVNKEKKLIDEYHN